MGQASTPSLRGPAIGFTQRDREAIVSLAGKVKIFFLLLNIELFFLCQASMPSLQGAPIGFTQRDREAIVFYIF